MWILSHYIGPTGENWIMDDAPRTPVVPRTAATLASINATNMTAYPALDVSYKHDRPGHGLCQEVQGIWQRRDGRDLALPGPQTLGLDLGRFHAPEVKVRQQAFGEEAAISVMIVKHEGKRHGSLSMRQILLQDKAIIVVDPIHAAFVIIRRRDDLRKITQTMAEELHHTEMLKSRLKKQARHKEVMQESYDVYTVAMNELVSIGCVERGRLMARLWESCLKLWSDLLETNDSLTQDVKGFMPKSDGVLNLTPSFAVELVNPLNTQLTELRATCSCCSSSLLAGGQGYNQLVKRFNTLSELMTNDANAPRPQQKDRRKAGCAGHGRAEDMKDAKGPMPLGVSLLTTQVISDVTKSAGPKYTNEVASTLEKQRQLHGDSAKSWYLESFGSNLPAGRRDVERLEQWLNTRVKQTDHKKKVVHEMHT
eukprot:gene5961-7166_t